MSILFPAWSGSDCLRRSALATPYIFGAAVLRSPVFFSMAVSPLFDVDTYLAVRIAIACLVVVGDPQIRGHTVTLLLSALIPATFFVWLISDHFHAGSVLEFHPGWAQNEREFKMSFLRFWFFNFGILVPLVLTLVGLIAWQVYQSHETRRFELTASIAIGLGGF